MAVGPQGSTSVTISITDSGGTPRTITGFVMELGGAEIEVELQSSEAFGDLWREFLPTGMRKVSPIPIKGFFDTTATTGPHVTLRPGDSDALPSSTARILVIVFGDSKTFTVSGWLNKYKAQANNGKLSDFESLFQPTGAGVWT
jgi:hypothetical protein